MLVPHLRNEIQDSPQKCDVFVQIDAEVMRMPPQMIDFCLLCCVANTAGYPVKLQTVERCVECSDPRALPARDCGAGGTGWQANSRCHRCGPMCRCYVPRC